MKKYEVYVNQGAIEQVFDSLDAAEHEMLVRGLIYSGIDSCDGGTRYYVPADRLDEADELVGDGIYPPGAIQAVDSVMGLDEIRLAIEGLIHDGDGSRGQWERMGRQDRMDMIVEVQRGNATAEQVADTLATWAEEAARSGKDGSDE